MSNKEAADQLWIEISSTLGFDDEQNMWEVLYGEKLWSLHAIAKKLGFSHTAIRRRLISAGFEMRERGGKNNLGKSKRILDRFDREFVMTGKVLDICYAAKVTPACVYSYRKLQKNKVREEELNEEASGSSV